ncbi:MAG TPA: hypothetical protein VMB26_05620 [Candidatus Binataceae bacterium]|nr:hypothetical protein [Candidatus Binataceae bacterium]
MVIPILLRRVLKPELKVIIDGLPGIEAMIKRGVDVMARGMAARG